MIGKKEQEKGGEPVNPSFVMTAAGYTIYALRKAFQGAIGYISYIAPYINDFYTHNIMQEFLTGLASIQLSLYGGYTALFSINAAWRLRNIWMNKGKYELSPKSHFKKVVTTVFTSAAMITDVTCLLATTLIALDVIVLMSAFAITAFLISGSINILKYGFKMAKQIYDHSTRDNEKAEDLNFQHKLAHYGINLSLSLVVGASLVVFFALPAPISTIAYMSILAVWAVAKFAYSYFGKKKLDAWHENAVKKIEEKPSANNAQLLSQSLSKSLHDKNDVILDADVSPSQLVTPHAVCHPRSSRG